MIIYSDINFVFTIISRNFHFRSRMKMADAMQLTYELIFYGWYFYFCTVVFAKIKYLSIYY